MDAPVITIVRQDGRGSDNPRFSIDGLPWTLERDGLENFDGMEHDVSTGEYAQYDGDYLLAERSPSLDRTIQAAAVGDVAALRSQAERFFVPGREYEVHVEAEGRRRFSRGRQYAFRLTVDNRRRVQRLTWTFLALDPMWLSESENRFDIAEAVPMFSFPFVSFARAVGPLPQVRAAAAAGEVPNVGGLDPECHMAGFVVGKVQRRINLSNDGDATCYPRFDITSTGPVSNPLITVSDEAGSVVCSIGVNVDLDAGDELVIDFSARPTAIELNGENASHLVSAGSTLAAGIDIGDYVVEWSAASGDAAMQIKPSIRERYTTI